MSYRTTRSFERQQTKPKYEIVISLKDFLSVHEITLKKFIEKNYVISKKS